jgi:hypothetical protein
LQTLNTNPGIFINSPLVEAEAFYRLRNYPGQISASLHHTLVTVPRKLAYILHERPASIAPAVEAFYLRDPIALKSLESSPSLIFPPKDLVTVSTRFTKVLYAQLKSQQQFSTPEAWRDTLGRSVKGTGSTAEKDHAQIEMGMKVTSGFEMLVSDSKNDDSRIVREIKVLLDDTTADGDGSLPSDKELSTWRDVKREDDEKWLDINFEDFEKELNGQAGAKKVPGTFGPEPPSGFGDAKTQDDLKKMVERFEAFMNDEDAGLDGAEMDDMDIDDDEVSEDDSEDEDKDVSFDENEFARMMREMMGMPPTEADISTKGVSKPTSQSNKTFEKLDSDEEDAKNEAEEIRKVMQRMEAELNEDGALNLDPTPKKLSALKDKSESGQNTVTKAEQDSDDESGDEEVNIDFNLAKNLLESFKSQAGMAGPGGNLLGMMGMQLPRDEGEEDLRRL